MEYYKASEALLDLENATSLDSLRAVIFQALYLLSCCMASSAYTRTCAGLTTALRMGLHVSPLNRRRTIEDTDESLFRRRQVFSVLYVTHVYLASTLGLPILLRDADSQQLLPLREVDMHDQGTSFARDNPHLPESETILAAKIFTIMARVNLCRHPSSKSILREGRFTYDVACSEVTTFESDLHAWYSLLPPIESIPHGGRDMLAQLLLRYAYAVTSISLYRPFLHHVTTTVDDPEFSVHGYAFASSCIRAAMEAIW
jgi:hypothetical protein